MRYCLLGSNSGRNAGDAAILASIIDEFRRVDPDAAFEVPTIAPAYIRRTYAHLNGAVQPVNILPYTGSLRLLGPTTLASVARCDATLLCAGITFDRKLLNPAFNFLITLAGLVPLGAALGGRFFAYCHGVGPLRTSAGRRLARWVHQRCADVLMRDEDSRQLLLACGVDPWRVSTWVDVAFVTRPAPARRVERILDDLGLTGSRPLIGVNVTSNLNLWSNTDGLSEKAFAARLAHALDELVSRVGPARTVLICTHRADIGLARRVRAHMARQDAAILANDPFLEDGTGYDCHDIAGVMGRLELMVGMRLHSLILALAATTPVVGISYAPKVAGTLRLLGLERNLVDLSSDGIDRLFDAVEQVWADRQRQRLSLAGQMAHVKDRVHAATERVWRQLAPQAGTADLLDHERRAHAARESSPSSA
jgi:polysaccharide pyruvyl transferase WcaK-like protein